MVSSDRSSTKNRKYWTNKIHDVLISLDKSAEGSDSNSGSGILPVKGGAEYGQFCYIASFKTDKFRLHSGTIKPDEIVVELQNYKVAGCTWHDLQLLFKELLAQVPTISMKLVKTGSGSSDLSKDLRPFLSQRFAKNTVEYQLQCEVRENLYMRTVPCTTRTPRPGEVNGVDYWFVSVDDFLSKDKNGELLESGVYDGNYYGTPRPPKDPPPMLPTSDNNAMMRRFAQINERVAGQQNGGVTNGIAGQQTSSEKAGLSSSSPNVQLNGSGDSGGVKENEPHSQGTAAGEEILPEGWERVEDPHYGVYYIDHINKRTQYDRPTAAAATAASLTVGAGLDGAGVVNGHSSGVLTTSSAADSNRNILSSPLPQQQQQQQLLQQHQQQQQQASTMNSQLPNQSGLRFISPSAQAAFFTADPSQLRGEPLKTRLTKPSTGFGFTIVGGDNTNEEFLQIKSIIPGGTADLDGKLKTGDVLVYVNGILTLGYSHADAVQLFQALPIGAQAEIEVCRGYPLPFDPNDPSMEYLTTVAVSHPQFAVPQQQAPGGRHFISPASPQHQPPSSTSAPPVVFYTIPIVKGPSGFGFTITTSVNGQRVKQILDRPRCRTLLEGDLLCEINSQPVANLPHPEVVSLLKQCPIGQEAVIVVQRNSPNFHSPPTSSSSMLLQQSTVLNPPAVSSSFLNGYGLPVPASMTRSFTAGDGFDNQMPVTHTTSEGFLLREERRVPESLSVPRYSQQQLQRSRTPGPDTTLRASGLTSSQYPTAAALVDDSQRVQQVMAMNQSFQTAMAGLSVSNGPALHSPIQVPYREFSISLRRFDSGFGFRLIGGREESSQISVGHIVDGGAAARDGRVLTGDEIIAIDGTPLVGASHQQAVQLMTEASQRGIVTLSLRRHFDQSKPQQQQQQALSLTLPRRNGTHSGMGSPRLTNSLSPPTPPQPLQAATILLSRSDEEGFGFVVVSSVNRSGSNIGHIIENSPAARCGQLRVHDRILAINGVDTSTLSHGDVINLIKESGQTLRLTILPAPIADARFNSPQHAQQQEQQQQQQLQHSQAMFPHTYQHQQLEAGMQTMTRSLTSGSMIPSPPLPPSAAFELVPVELHRGARGFGFSIRGGREFGGMPLYVLRIADGGAAALDGRLQVGDEILEINGQSAMGMTHAQAIELIQSAGSPIVRLVVRRFRKTDT